MGDKNTYSMMQGYGHDESAPTPGGVFRNQFRGCSHAFAERSQRVRFLYVTYSHYKSMVFDVQKYGFWGAKRGFLSYKSMVFVF